MARMTATEREKKKDHAKILYTKENVTNQKELAQRVGVTEKTIGKWIKDEGWEKLKKNLLLTRQEMYSNLLEDFEKLQNHISSTDLGFADFKLANTRRNLVKDIKDMEAEKIGLSEKISVQVEFLEFVRKRNHEHAIMIADYSDLFIKSKL